MQRGDHSHKASPSSQHSTPAQQFNQPPRILLSPILGPFGRTPATPESDATLPPTRRPSSSSSSGADPTFRRYIIQNFSLEDESEQVETPTTPLTPTFQQWKTVSDSQTFGHTSDPGNLDTHQPKLMSRSSHSSLRSSTTGSDHIRSTLSRRSSLSASLPRLPAPHHQPQSQPTLSPQIPPVPEAGPVVKPRPSMQKMPDKYASQPRHRSGIKIVHDKDEEDVPTSGMLWYRAPVHGALPGRTLRSHTTTTIRNKAWVIGGCDDKQSYRDIYCLDYESLQWTHPGYKGDVPPPCRGHTATAVDYKIVLIGGMSTHASTEPISVYVFDTLTQTWSRPRIAGGRSPVQRRAHSAVLWDEKIWIFGGGNGFSALDDVWSLDVSTLIDVRRATVISRTERSGLRWEKIETKVMKRGTELGGRPDSRGYHTANIVDHLMVIIGGADGKGILDTVWVLNLKTKAWYHVNELKGTAISSRLAHSSTRLGPYLFIFGGVAKEYNSDLHLLNLVTLQYEQRRVYGKPPTPRAYHTTVHGNDRVYIIGGANATNAFDDVWILELASLSYLHQITDFRVEPLEDIGWY